MAKEIVKPVDAQTALATVGEHVFAILTVDPEETKRIVQQNLGDNGMDSLSLDRIKMPSGGGMSYILPTLEGDKPVQVIVGVIIAWQDVRVFWDSDYDGSRNPPTCSASDARMGYGDPGGSCAECPFSQFGSKIGKDGQPAAGQACNECRRLYVLTPDNRLPIMISLPPTSGKAARKYFQRLASKGVAYYAVATKIGLVTQKNSTGIEYSEATLSVAAMLTPEQVAAFSRLHEVFAPDLKAIKPTADDYTTATTGQSAAEAADAYDAEQKAEPAGSQAAADAADTDAESQVDPAAVEEPTAGKK